MFSKLRRNKLAKCVVGATAIEYALVASLIGIAAADATSATGWKVAKTMCLAASWIGGGGPSCQGSGVDTAIYYIPLWDGPYQDSQGRSHTRGDNPDGTGSDGCIYVYNNPGGTWDLGVSVWGSHLCAAHVSAPPPDET